MHDGSGNVKAKESQKQIKESGLNMISFPPDSCDLNPTENLVNQLKVEVQEKINLYHERNGKFDLFSKSPGDDIKRAKKMLRKYIDEGCKKLQKKNRRMFVNLAESMPDRIASVIKVKGNASEKY